jgi:large subunit ribosomal protein L21
MSEQETTPAEGVEPEAAEPKPARAKKAKAEAAKAEPKAKGYAIVETGGKQYRVSVGDRISVERIAAEDGAEITIDRVLLLGGDGATRVGAPTVPGATVTATVDEHFRGEKIVVFKYKPKKRYRRRIGHRQELTHLTVTAING